VRYTKITEIGRERISEVEKRWEEGTKDGESEGWAIPIHETAVSPEKEGVRRWGGVGREGSREDPKSLERTLMNFPNRRT
jgi:hypothetical protein